MSKRRKLLPAPPPQIKIGDHVLAGSTRASYPGEWYCGTVLWVGSSDLLIERSTLTGETWREVVTVAGVRAVGTIEQLAAVQRRASEGVRVFHTAIRDAESALGAARSALFGELDRLYLAGFEVIPPDFARIDADDAAARRIVEQASAEWGAAHQAKPAP